MFKSLLSAGAAFAVCTVLSAAPEITISSDPALPRENRLVNADFEASRLLRWIPFPARDHGIATDASSAAQGTQSLKMPGSPEQRFNVYQRIQWTTPLTAGEPYCVRLAAKKEGAKINVKPASLACQFAFTDGKTQYVQMPALPQEDYDWAVFEIVGTAPKDVKSATFYLCHYNQTGVQWFDDVQFWDGTVKLTVSVKGDELKQVVVRNSVTGTVLNEVVSGNEFAKTLTVPAFGSYSVEVTDAAGVRTGKLYPENVDANVAASDSVVPLLPGKRVVLAPEKAADVLSFELPDVTGKKVYLEFSARNQKLEGIAGNTGSLKLVLNGKMLGEKELVKPGVAFTMANGRGGKFFGGNGYVLYYGNSFFNISKDNQYSPVSLEDRNPFNFKLDVTRWVKTGLNKLELSNTLKVTPKVKFDVYVENLRVVIE